MWLEIKTDLMWVGDGGWWWWWVVLVGVEGENRNKLGACQFYTTHDYLVYISNEQDCYSS